MEEEDEKKEVKIATTKTTRCEPCHGNQKWRRGDRIRRLQCDQEKSHAFAQPTCIFFQGGYIKQMLVDDGARE